MNSLGLAGTPARRTAKKKSKSIAWPYAWTQALPAMLAAAALQEHELLEEVHVLLVLHQRPVERRDGGLVPLLAQRLGRNVLGEEELQPVQQLGGRRLLL